MRQQFIKGYSFHKNVEGGIRFGAMRNHASGSLFFRKNISGDICGGSETVWNPPTMFRRVIALKMMNEWNRENPFRLGANYVVFRIWE